MERRVSTPAFDAVSGNGHGRRTARHVALVSSDKVLIADASGPRDDDLPLLEAALQQAGATVTICSWTAVEDWSRFDAAVLRSTWDYTEQLDRFLLWAADTAEVTRLRNPLPVVRWNIDKRYLGDLQRHGVPVIPTFFVERGQDPVEALSAWPRAAEVVVKPTVGAGSRGARRFTMADPEQRWQAAGHVAALHGTGRGVMVQPYLPSVDARGETALVFSGGTLVHAVRKGPLLPADGAAGGSVLDSGDLGLRTADDDERAVAEAALDAVSRCTDGASDGRAMPYARVDVVRDEEGRTRVLELELVEPSLFLSTSPASAAHVAAAILASL